MSKEILGKINQRTGLMWRITSCISMELAVDLYKSLIDPIFIYCSQLYDACTITSSRQLQICQNKARRAVLRVGNRYSTEKLHVESGMEWLGIQQAKTTCTEMYKLVWNIGPPNLCNCVTIKEPSRVLRSNAKIQLNCPVAKHVFANNNFLICGKQYWDMLNAGV